MEKNKKSKVVKYDYNSIFQYAELFRKATDLLVQTINGGEMLVIPWVVNSAFTIELYLKCLITIENGVYREEHNLYKLFDVLSRDSRKIIALKYDELVSSDPTSSAMNKQFNGTLKLDVASVLKDMAKAFTKYRYGFETLPQSGFMNSGIIQRVVVQRILDLKPDIGDVIAKGND